jgi:hypothetical protein
MLYQILAYLRLRPSSPYRCEPALTTSGLSHPLFTTTSITTHNSLLETDYNMHKSNSAYFTDLDVARTPLVTRLCSPGVGIIGREMKTEYREQRKRQAKGGLKDEKPLSRPGPTAIVLGSVYCNFKREIRPFQRYEIRSKLISWDHKWMYILTYFIGPEKHKGAGKTLLAMGVSKYVIKKGRLTIRPERVLRTSGLLPPKPEGVEQGHSSTCGSSTPSSPSDPSSGDEFATESVDGAMMREVLTLSDSSPSPVLDRQREENGSWDKHEWTWERIEQERLRGLKLMEGFIGLDTGLDKEMEF